MFFLASLMSELSCPQGDTELRFPAMELLLGNALMLTTPLKALAETCEAENSFFNMPLLLAVALVGATVGGKILLMFMICIVYVP